MKDILVKIPDDGLPRLATLYQEKCISWAPYMVSFVHTAIKWKKLEKYKGKLNFWSPFDSWEKDGTFIAMFESHCLDIYVFTLSEDAVSIYEALMQVDLIDYSKRVLFYGVHEKHTPTVLKYIEDKKLSVAFNVPCYIYTMPPEKGEQLTIECPPDVYLKKLESSAAKRVNELWPHRFPGSEDYLASFIEANGGWGVFLKSSNEMVAWVLKHAFGHLGMLQTEEEHKRKGYGSLVTRTLSKEIAEEGHWPLGTILLNNRPSITMFEKMGFQNIGICNFIGVEKRNREAE